MKNRRKALVRRLILIGAGAGGPSWMQARGALWNRSHPAFWRSALWALVYQLAHLQGTSIPFVPASRVRSSISRLICDEDVRSKGRIVTDLCIPSCILSGEE
jgi:hypothetical protein